jgi:hypothetical protein
MARLTVRQRGAVVRRVRVTMARHHRGSRLPWLHMRGHLPSAVFDYDAEKSLAVVSRQRDCIACLSCE